MKDAIYLFGGLDVGLALPVSAQRQKVWELVSDTGDGLPNSWGGHCVNITAYDETGLTCVTWGAEKRMSWKFFRAYCDEAYAIVSDDFLTNGVAPNGFDVKILRDDLKRLR